MGTLNAFVDRPALRAAFEVHAQGWLRPIPQVMRTQAPLARLGWATAAFQYLVRFEVGRWSVVNRVEAAATSWIARLGLHNLTCFPHLASQSPRWTRFIDGAERRIGDYFQGQDVSLTERIHLALLLAQLDPLYRDPARGASRWKPPTPPSAQMLTQLTEWVERFRNDWEAQVPSGERLLINPEYAWVPAVGGADADVVIDGTLLGLDTTIRGDTQTQVRRLVGHAAMSWLAGFHLPGQPHLGAPVEAIALYRVRAENERWHTFPLAELFPGNHWQAYLTAFAQEARQG